MAFKSVFFTFNFCSHFEGVNIVSIFASSMLRLAHEFALLLGLSDLPDMKSPKFLTATKAWGFFRFLSLTFSSYTGRHFGCCLKTLYKAA